MLTVFRVVLPFCVVITYLSEYKQLKMTQRKREGKRKYLPSATKPQVLHVPHNNL